MKDLFFGGLLIATGLVMIGVIIGASVWLVAFALSALVGILDSGFAHGFALATSIFGG